MAVAISAADTSMLIEKVRHDTALATRVRTGATRISRLAAQPERALERLQQLALSELPRLPRDLPTRPLSRVVTAETFWRYLANPEAQGLFTTSVDFIRYIETSASPSAELVAMLAEDPILFPWTRSWLTETEGIRGMSGAQLNAALELGKRPPFVVFDLSLPVMVEVGVTVRAPNALDSVLGPNPQWSPTGLASGLREYVDWDLPRAAVDAIDWRYR